MFNMILIDRDGNRFTLCSVVSINAARAIWRCVASMEGSNLSSFEVVAVEYEGNYITDEC